MIIYHLLSAFNYDFSQFEFKLNNCDFITCWMKFHCTDFMRTNKDLIGKHSSSCDKVVDMKFTFTGTKYHVVTEKLKSKTIFHRFHSTLTDL